jgi:hypothetical protein
MNNPSPATAISPPGQRLIDDMNMRETRRDHIRDVGRFAMSLGLSPDTATVNDVRRLQIEQRDAGVRADAQAPRAKMSTPAIIASLSAFNDGVSGRSARSSVSRRQLPRGLAVCRTTDCLLGSNLARMRRIWRPLSPRTPEDGHLPSNCAHRETKHGNGSKLKPRSLTFRSIGWQRRRLGNDNSQLPPHDPGRCPSRQHFLTRSAQVVFRPRGRGFHARIRANFALSRALITDCFSRYGDSSVPS